MMKKLFVTRDLTSFVNRGAKVIPQVDEAAPVTLSLVLGAAVIWVVFAIAMGLVAAVFRGTPLDTLMMIVGLIGISMPVFWLGEVVNLFSQSRLHDTFLFSWVPPLGYVPLTESPRLVQVAAAARGSRCPCSTSASTRACCAPRSSSRRRRTTCGPPARRASPSGASCFGTRCARR